MMRRPQRSPEALRRANAMARFRKLSNKVAKRIELDPTLGGTTRGRWAETTRGKCAACGIGESNRLGTVGVRRFQLHQRIDDGSLHPSIAQSTELCAYCVLQVVGDAVS